MESKSFQCPDCHTVIPGTNCALTLAKYRGWRKVPGCYYHCPCGFPVRAKEVRDHIFKSFINNDKNSTQSAYIYCQRGNQGHVYYGTFSICEKGNGTTAASMNADTFERYAQASP